MDSSRRTNRWSSVMAGVVLVVLAGLTGCGFGNDWRNESRCQPPGGGLNPEQVLPDPVACPEAYKGNPGGGSAPGSGQLGECPYAPGCVSVPRETSPSDPCSGPGLNGFVCYPVDPDGNPGPYYP